MNDLESLVASRELSQQLVDAHIVIPTALVWVGLWGMDAHWHVESRAGIEMMRAYPEKDRVENGATAEDRGLVTVPAPTMSELQAFLTPDSKTTTEWWADVVLKIKGKVKP